MFISKKFLLSFSFSLYTYEVFHSRKVERADREKWVLGLKFLLACCFCLSCTQIQSELKPSSSSNSGNNTTTTMTTTPPTAEEFFSYHLLSCALTSPYGSCLYSEKSMIFIIFAECKSMLQVLPFSMLFTAQLPPSTLLNTLLRSVLFVGFDDGKLLNVHPMMTMIVDSGF